MSQTEPTFTPDPIIKLIENEDIDALDAAFKNGWKVNKPLATSKWRDELPIIIAVESQKLKSIQWLISKKVNLNDKKHPAIVPAGRTNKQILQSLLDNGANINAIDFILKNVISDVLYSKKMDLITFIVERGFDVKKDGRSLRQAVFSRQHKAVQMLLDLGFDPNFHLRDQVFPHNPSAVHIAARNKNDFKTVKLLVEHGADIKLKDEYGDRPYNDALLNKDAPLMAYLKAMEPPEWHDEALHLANLAPYNLPPSLIKICQSKQRIINICKETVYGVRWVEMHQVLSLKVATFGKKEFVEIVADTDNYDNFLVWYPAKNCLAYIDYEHDEFKKLGKWEDFLENPEAFFAKYLSDYF